MKISTIIAQKMWFLRIYWFCVGALVASILMNYAEAKTYKAVVIDDGFHPMYQSKTKLCKRGHYDFYTNKPKLSMPMTPHGTFVTLAASSMIDKKRPGCFIIFNVFGPIRYRTAENIANAINRAVKIGATHINLSIESPNTPYPPIHKAIRRAVKRRIHVFVAAGNLNLNLNRECRSYPSCYPIRSKYMHRVGAIDKYGRRAFYSNYGAIVTEWFPGDLGPQWGTSFASPRAMGHHIQYGDY